MSVMLPAEAVKAYFEALGTADLEAFLGLFSADAHLEDPVGSPALSGQEGVARFHKMVGRAWQELRMEPSDVYVRGDRVAARWSARGHSASGKRITFGGISVFAVDDEGKIARLEGYWDFDQVMAQF